MDAVLLFLLLDSELLLYGLGRVALHHAHVFLYFVHADSLLKLSVVAVAAVPTFHRYLVHGPF